jgi:hypothetical protein
LRAFWAILGVLMLASAVYLLVGREAPAPSSSAPQQVASTAQPPRPANPPPSPPAAAQQPAQEVQQPTPDPIQGGEETIDRTTFPPQPAGAGENGGAPASAPPPQQDPQPEERQAAAPSEPTEPLREPDPPSGQTAEMPDAPDAPSPTETTDAGPNPDSSATAEAQQPAPAAQELTAKPAADQWLITREDGTMVADGRYPIRGKGTLQEPFKITWEHLISAEEEYVPREGRSEIPKRIAMLHDKHVEITGYVAFPMLMDEADELLVMLNQWDGCCLGVPPTPYDAVEVRLKDFVTGNARMTSYGTLKGIMKVEPHLVGEWLVGLYMMEDASMAPLAYGGFAP